MGEEEEGWEVVVAVEGGGVGWRQQQLGRIPGAAKSAGREAAEQQRATRAPPATAVPNQLLRLPH